LDEGDAAFSSAAVGAGEEGADAAGDGAAVEGAGAAGDGAAVEETLADGFAKDSGEGELTGLVEIWGDADEIGEAAVEGVVAGLALRTSLSSMPTRRPMLSLAVSTVNSNVTPKKMQPR
jgi:hypothetical protein